MSRGSRRYKVGAVNQVHVLDFARLADGIKQTLGDRLSMVYDGDDGQALFISQTWRRLFEVRAPVVREFMLEFFSTYKMSDIKMGLDLADTLCFQLGGARRLMTWRQFILELGLHSKEEMAKAGFRAYWSGSEGRTGVGEGDRGRKSGARLSGGHFIGRLAAHFGLVGDQGLRERQQVAATGSSGAAEDAPAVDEGAQAVPAPV
ncbi:hypothetical protein Tco_0870698 [Tanacetum coccineum]